MRRLKLETCSRQGFQKKMTCCRLVSRTRRKIFPQCARPARPRATCITFKRVQEDASKKRRARALVGILYILVAVAASLSTTYHRKLFSVRGSTGGFPFSV